ncbi:hypothetical protein [Mycobacterium sp. SMC-4]|uniref:hypothetical protein n=1 Tax=Mycobacterium sp. SMC-4 TaxID=2857059 RepID=UPI0021B26B95|nr:hypothetical protein [Mycobacterium sp. SMC-4]UXA19544.1 hypothetical protein KXD98_08080 [Mycobacterium sp. SMC-4]
MKVRIKVRPTGYVSLDGGPLTAWPPVGTVVDLPEAMAEDLVNGGRAEKVRVGRAEPISETVETRPAQTADEEQRAKRPTARKGASTGE